jgi:hypothetical protein
MSDARESISYRAKIGALSRLYFHGQGDKVNNGSLPYCRPTSVGESPTSGAATLVVILGLIGTSFAASYVVAGMTHATGSPAFAGLRLFFAWAAWWYSTVNVNGYYVPGQHVHVLTAYGWSVVHAIWITLCVGCALTLALYVGLNRLASRKSDVSEIKDSARMAKIDDLRRAGFLAGD